MAIYGIQKQIYSRIEELETFPCSVKAQTMDPTLLHDRLQKKTAELQILYDLAAVLKKHHATLQSLKPKTTHSQVPRRIELWKNEMRDAPPFESLTDDQTLINYGNGLQAGLTPREIALKYGVSSSCVVERLHKLVNMCFSYKVKAGIVSSGRNSIEEA